MASDTRERILESSGELFRRQGYMGTGVKQIVEEAGAPSSCSGYRRLYAPLPRTRPHDGQECVAPRRRLVQRPPFASAHRRVETVSAEGPPTSRPRP